MLDKFQKIRIKMIRIVKDDPNVHFRYRRLDIEILAQKSTKLRSRKIKSSFLIGYLLSVLCICRAVRCTIDTHFYCRMSLFTDSIVEEHARAQRVTPNALSNVRVQFYATTRDFA